MKRGKTEIETLKLNGWGVGTILEGVDILGRTDRIKITALGLTNFLCVWHCDLVNNSNDFESRDSVNTSLNHRDWVEVKPEVKPVKKKKIPLGKHMRQNQINYCNRIEKCRNGRSYAKLKAYIREVKRQILEYENGTIKMYVNEDFIDSKYNKLFQVWLKREELHFIFSYRIRHYIIKSY